MSLAQILAQTRQIWRRAGLDFPTVEWEIRIRHGYCREKGIKGGRTLNQFSSTHGSRKEKQGNGSRTFAKESLDTSKGFVLGLF